MGVYQPLVCEVLRELKKETVMVIDHDISVQSEFDQILELTKNQNGETTINCTVNL